MSLPLALFSLSPDFRPLLAFGLIAPVKTPPTFPSRPAHSLCPRMSHAFLPSFVTRVLAFLASCCRSPSPSCTCRAPVVLLPAAPTQCHPRFAPLRPFLKGDCRCGTPLCDPFTFVALFRPPFPIPPLVIAVVAPAAPSRASVLISVSSAHAGHVLYQRIASLPTSLPLSTSSVLSPRLFLLLACLWPGPRCPFFFVRCPCLRRCRRPTSVLAVRGHCSRSFRVELPFFLTGGPWR